MSEYVAQRTPRRIKKKDLHLIVESQGQKEKLESKKKMTRQIQGNNNMINGL